MTGAVVRVAAGAQVADAGALTAEAYLADRLVDASDSYADELRDAERRAREATLLVALIPPGEGDGANDRDDDLVVVGTVTLAPYGTSYAEVAEPGELEIRMLAVAPEARRRGIAELLVSAALREAVAGGATRVVLSTLDSMEAAQRLYQRLGFVAVPERDWGHVEVHLRVHTWTAPDAPGALVESATWPPARVVDVDGWRVGSVRRADPPRQQRPAARHPARRHGDARPGRGALRGRGAALDRARVPRVAAGPGRPARAARLRGDVPDRRAGAGARRARTSPRRRPHGRRTGAGRRSRTDPDDAWLAAWSGSKARLHATGAAAEADDDEPRAWPAACSAGRPPSTSRRRTPRDWSA